MNQMNWTPLGPPLPPPLPPSRRMLVFSGDRGEFLRLVRRGVGLELVTAGFYRFWLVTDIRRHLWSNTLIDGDAAEYTGRPKELLIGFLFALAILAPIYLFYFWVTVEAEHYQAFASFPLLAFFYIFGQFAIFRARRYRLTRTVWRGVRLWMTGSGWSYAARATLWGLLTIITLGLAFPWREAALERYKMQHSHYGDLQGNFEGRGWDLFKRIWWFWLAAPVAVILFPLMPAIYAKFKTIGWHWWLSGIRFGDVRLESDLDSSELHVLYWKVIGWSLLLLMGYTVFMALGATLTLWLSGASLEQTIGPNGKSSNIPFLIVTVIGYLALVLSFGVVMRVYLQRDLWAKVLESTSVHGLDAAAGVSARGEIAGALGEGFADGLDVAGF